MSRRILPEGHPVLQTMGVHQPWAAYLSWAAVNDSPRCWQWTAPTEVSFHSQYIWKRSLTLNWPESPCVVWALAAPICLLLLRLGTSQKSSSAGKPKGLAVQRWRPRHLQAPVLGLSPCSLEHREPPRGIYRLTLFPAEYPTSQHKWDPFG